MFLKSAAKDDQFPEIKLPEIAFVGRSNVGKSSLLNHFTQNKKLAHVSSKPGKTQLINFFNYKDQYTLVDLPGYGFAKVSKTTRQKWGELIESYLQNRRNLTLILLLVDLRHPPTQEDLAFAKWAIHFRKKLLIIFTKSDKLSTSEKEKNVRENTSLLKEAIGDKPFRQIPYSIKDPKARIALAKTIEDILK